MNMGDEEFTGDALFELVIAIELAIAIRSAGATPLGIAVTNLCEDALVADREKRK